MAWFGGKVTLGSFPDLAEAVNKIQERVKTIEKNFDNALGIEEKLESTSDEVHFHEKTIAGEDKEAVKLEKDNEHPEAWEKADTAITDPAEVEPESETGFAKPSKSSFQDVDSLRSPDDEKPKENPDVVSLTTLGCSKHLPFKVTDQEREIISFQRSTFILGRSGTGKTIVLIMKLLQKEELHRLATEGDDEATPLRQLFVTTSPKLCHAVRHHIQQMKRFISGGSFSEESDLQDDDDVGGAAQFKNIQAYPLVIPFQKFLLMLDRTVGDSFFKRFSDVGELSDPEDENAQILAQNCIRTREVTFDKFCTNYWPHFNAKFTNQLASSRVFTEIMSHIKGGLRSGDSCDGRLSFDDYVKLSEGRASTLASGERKMIYNIFRDYEKKKGENGEFDMADVVIDLHHRLQNERYEGDIMDFVHIDEVQDLTMRQIGLFKHICKNVSEGFVFCGDTAQTIGRGIDFRFEDIRSLFYNEFVLESRSETDKEKKEKSQISKTFHLSQNFRTHDGVLRLAQSVIDLLYGFFPSFVDALSPETSLIYGEAPIWIQSHSKDNAVTKIFAKDGGNMVGFGAEQVILVRDDPAKKEIVKYVGKQALVLTIMECKGLEFQDVLLYNFFGSSPLKNHWRVVYEYMKKEGLLDASYSSPSFKQAKHNIMCSELKELYVAITRTRQRLLICENSKEFSGPMFDYWKKKDLIQVRKMDDSFAQAIQVASSPEEWKSSGYKLLHQGNFEMAKICFERANDSYGEKLSKALGLKSCAELLHCSNPEMASNFRRQAAGIFNSIDKAKEAAECFYLLEEYEKAAEVYAQEQNIAKCLYNCAKGKLFEKGLNYIQYWKDRINAHEMIGKCRQLEKAEQSFLKLCALHYHRINEKKTMMIHVHSFASKKTKRAFLQSIGRYDELLSLGDREKDLKAVLSLCTVRRSDQDLDIPQPKDLGSFRRLVDTLKAAENIKDKETLISRALELRAKLQCLFANVPCEVEKGFSRGQRVDFLKDSIRMLLQMKEWHDLLEPSKLEHQDSLPLISDLFEDMRPGWQLIFSFLLLRPFDEGNRASSKEKKPKGEKRCSFPFKRFKLRYGNVRLETF